MVSSLTESRPSNPHTRPKNRVGGFSAASYSCTSVTWSQAGEPHRETGDVATSGASGIVSWLSKDPIGISGGLNQYVAFGNCPVIYQDPLGLAAGDEYGSGKAAAVAALQDVSELTKFGHRYGSGKVVDESWARHYGGFYHGYPEKPIPPGFEWGGVIYRNSNGTFSYTAPLTVCRIGDVPARQGRVPRGSEPVGMYHSHPGQWLPDLNGQRIYGPLNGEEFYNGFSTGANADAGIADDTPWIQGSFLAAPNGNFLVYRPDRGSRKYGDPREGRVFGVAR